jgi:uncharacterized membrane protein
MWMLWVVVAVVAVIAISEWLKSPRTANQYEYITDENGNETVKDNSKE